MRNAEDRWTRRSSPRNSALLTRVGDKLEEPIAQDENILSAVERFPETKRLHPVTKQGDHHVDGGTEGDGGVMKRVLLTGMSGTGKSTVIEALAARGYKALDTDYGELSELVNVPIDEPTGLEPGQDWVWREDRIHDLLTTEDADVLFVSGCAPNQGKFYPRFDHIILLSAPAPVLVQRLATRTNNPYGKRPEDVARVLGLLQTVEPMLRSGADHEVDTSMPLSEVVATVLQLVGEGD